MLNIRRLIAIGMAGACGLGLGLGLGACSSGPDESPVAAAPQQDDEAAMQAAIAEHLASGPDEGATEPPAGYNTAVNDYFKRLEARAQEQTPANAGGSR